MYVTRVLATYEIDTNGLYFFFQEQVGGGNE